MSDRTTTRRRRVAAAGLTVAALVAVGIGATQALFTDEETIDNNVFGSGTIDLTTTPTTQRFNATGMMPGDVITLPVTLDNVGSGELRYAMTSVLASGDPNLADTLRLRIREDVTTCTTAGFTADGTDVAGPRALVDNSGVPGSERVIGDAADGTQAGDRVLASGANEVLCFQVELPLGADNTSEGLSSTVDFWFYAEQTANNA